MNAFRPSFSFTQAAKPADKLDLPPEILAWFKKRGTIQKKASATLRKIAALYPGLTIGRAKGGFTIHATRLAVPRAKLVGYVLRRGVIGTKE